MKKRLLSMALMLAMVAALVPVFSIGVAASQPELNVVGAQAEMRTLGLAMSNLTTAADIMNAVRGDVDNPSTALGLPGHIANPATGFGTAPYWAVPFNRVDAAIATPGLITGTIRLTWFNIAGADFTFDVVINRTIPALTDYQAIIDAAVASAQQRVNSIPVTNQTEPADILNMAASGLPTGATAVWSVSDPFAINYAAVSTPGSITGIIVLTLAPPYTPGTGGTYTAEVVVNRTIFGLTDFQTIVDGQMALALARVESLRPVVNNNTSADTIIGAARSLVNMGSLLAGVYADWHVPFNLVPATELGSGRITGTIRLTMETADGTVTADVVVDLPILPLGQRHALHWNHITETLSVADGGLLYAVVRMRPNQTIDDVDWTRVRWFPLEGELHLGRMIPRRADRRATIAIRDAESARDMAFIATPTNMWMPSIRTQGDARLITIQGRTPLARGNVAWSAVANDGHGGLVTGSPPACIFAERSFAFLVGRAGVNGWTVAGPRTQANFPMGSPLEIREIASPTTLSGIIAMDVDTIVPATTSLRIRVPAIPAAPRINALPDAATDETAIRGIRANAQIAILPAGELASVAYGAPLPGGRTWVDAPSANPTAAAARAQVSGDTNVANDGVGDMMLVRLVDANGRRPNSFYAVVALPAATPPTP